MQIKKRSRALGADREGKSAPQRQLLAEQLPVQAVHGSFEPVADELFGISFDGRFNFGNSVGTNVGEFAGQTQQLAQLGEICAIHPCGT